ncbi:penicillin-binding protein activator, partial [Cronobacter sakazakii]
MVPSKFSGSKAARCLPVLLAALFFAGCGTQTADQSTAHMQGEAKADSGFYLHQMEQSRDDSKTNWQLLAIRALLSEGKRERAMTLYGELPQNLTDAQRREASLLEAQIKLAQQDYQGAAALLNNINAADLSDEQKARYWQAKIDASQGRPSLELLRALIAQEPLLQGAAKQKNIDATWQALSQMSADQAKALVINADENTLQGWLDLQRVWLDNRNDPKMLQAGVKDWQTRYPQNPGAKMLPSQLANLQNYKPASADKIALLLPLNGQAAVFGRAIQQGFEAAKNAGTSPVAAQSSTPAPAQADNAALPTDSTQPQPTDGVASPAAAPVDDLAAQPDAPQNTQPAQQPVDAQPVAAAPANPAAEIKIYDTSSQSITQILAQAQQDGASLVVGPLLKESVDGVLKSGTPLNVLALNQPETVQNRPN